MYQSIHSCYYWHDMGWDIRNYVQQCQHYQNILIHYHKPYRLLESLPVPICLLDWVSIDFITGLLPSKWHRQVYNTVLVVVDIFTKYCWYYPCTKDITADELADLFYDDFICSEGAPANIVSDHRSLFISEFWSVLCHNLGIKQQLSTAYHPQTDDQIEH